MAESNNGTRGGYLTVVVRTASGALPIEGATVTVESDEEGGRFIRTLYTNESGRTPLLQLETPAAAGSLAPGGVRPYAIYNIRVEKDGYYPHENRGAPVFAGVTSVQGVEMIPLSPYGDGTPPVGSTDFSSGQSLDGEG